MHKTLKCSPAMAAGISKTLWSMEDVVALIDAQAEAPKHPRFIKNAGRDIRRVSALLNGKATLQCAPKACGFDPRR